MYMSEICKEDVESVRIEIQNPPSSLLKALAFITEKVSGAARGTEWDIAYDKEANRVFVDFHGLGLLFIRIALKNDYNVSISRNMIWRLFVV